MEGQDWQSFTPRALWGNCQTCLQHQQICQEARALANIAAHATQTNYATKFGKREKWTENSHIATIFYLGLRLVTLSHAKEHELASRTDLDKEIVERRWNELHRKNAKMVHQHILKYRGLLTKFGDFPALEACLCVPCASPHGEERLVTALACPLSTERVLDGVSTFAKLSWLSDVMADNLTTTPTGQAASTKAGSLPAPWVEELRGLQDELPISNFQDVS